MSQCTLLSWASDGKGSCVSWLLQLPKVGLVAVQVMPEKEKGNSVQNDGGVGRKGLSGAEHVRTGTRVHLQQLDLSQECQGHRGGVGEQALDLLEKAETWASRRQAIWRAKVDPLGFICCSTTPEHAESYHIWE